MTEVASHHFCHILRLAVSHIGSSPHSRGGAYPGHEYQEAGITKGHLLQVLTNTSWTTEWRKEKGKGKRDWYPWGKPSGCPHTASHGPGIPMESPGSEFQKVISLGEAGGQSEDQLTGTHSYDMDGWTEHQVSFTMRKVTARWASSLNQLVHVALSQFDLILPSLLKLLSPCVSFSISQPQNSHGRLDSFIWTYSSADYVTGMLDKRNAEVRRKCHFLPRSLQSQGGDTSTDADNWVWPGTSMGRGLWTWTWKDKKASHGNDS